MAAEQATYKISKVLMVVNKGQTTKGLVDIMFGIFPPPVAAAVCARTEGCHGEKARMTPERSVLIVEDVPSIAALEADLVTAGGGHATIVGDGQTALVTMRHAPFTLILLDLSLPLVSGQVILRTMAADPALCQTPVIVVSGSLDGFQPTSQVVALFPKPFEPDELVETIQRTLAQYGQAALLEPPIR